MSAFELPHKLLRTVDVPEGVSGGWAVQRFEVSQQDVEFARLRYMLNRRREGLPPTAGRYTRLVCSGDVVMSDTPAEMAEHRRFVRQATGCVLVAGLGLGVVLQALADKPEVQHVRVIEKSEDVIRLVWSHWSARYGDRIELVHADALEYVPARGERYDAAWFDIWTNRCVGDLQEHAVLLRRWARRAKIRGCWIHEELKEAKRYGW